MRSSCQRQSPGVKRQQQLSARGSRHKAEDCSAAGHTSTKLLLWMWRQTAADRPRRPRVSKQPTSLPAQAAAIAGAGLLPTPLAMRCSQKASTSYFWIEGSNLVRMQVLPSAQAPYRNGRRAGGCRTCLQVSHVPAQPCALDASRSSHQALAAAAASSCCISSTSRSHLPARHNTVHAVPVWPDSCPPGTLLDSHAPSTHGMLCIADILCQPYG